MRARWEITRLVIFVSLFILLWISAFIFAPNIINKCLNFPNVNKDLLNITSIVLGAVAAFAGLLIPLHYALTLDIIGKIKESNNCLDSCTGEIAGEEREWLLRYCHTSDIVVFVTAIFGVSSLLEGALTVGADFGAIRATTFYEISKVIGIVYLVIVFYSIGVSVCKAQTEWRLKYLNKSFIWYCVFTFFVGILSIGWGFLLIYMNNAAGIAFIALVIISLFYFLWLALRIRFTPMSRVASISLFNKK